MNIPVKVSATENGIKLYRWLGRHYADANMMLTRRLCRNGEIRINSKRCGPDAVLRAGDMVRIPPALANRRPGPATEGGGYSLAELEKLRRAIIHDDDDIVVFDKPAGLAAQGGRAVRRSLDKMAVALFPNATPLLVHRLDRETSGIMVVAKNHAAAQKLSADFQTKRVKKTYVALLSGDVRMKKGVIDSPVDGKRAITKYEVAGGLKSLLTFVKFYPETGRKHQLRVHSAEALGAPIVGDDLYGGRRYDNKLQSLLSADHLYLLAWKITFTHPRSGKLMTIRAEMPEWMKGVAELCEIKL